MFRKPDVAAQKVFGFGPLVSELGIILTVTDLNQILSKFWNYQGSIRAETSGGSRSTWQLENGNWLSSCPIEKESQFRSETDLLISIQRERKNQSSSISCPAVVLSSSGETLLEADGALWRMTENVNGVKMKATDFRTYPALKDGLDSLHNLFLNIDLSRTSLKTGVLENVEKITPDESHHTIVKELLKWTQIRINSLRRFPIVVTHGDFNPTNVLYHEESGRVSVVGVLDFELTRPDPAILDYSQLLTMIVCHSGSSNPQADADTVFEMLKDQFNRDELCVAMAAYWLDLYFGWRLSSPAAEEKIRSRLVQVSEFIHMPQ